MSAGETWLDVLRGATAQLQTQGIEGPAREARLLLAEALHIDAAEMISIEREPVDAPAADRFAALMQLRIGRMPLSRIRGWREFYGRRFTVTPGVLDPRPETELLVDQAIRRLPRDGRLLDLGTGSGCILVSVLAERPDVTGVGLDISRDALVIARANAVSLGVAERAGFIEGRWGAAAETGAFDVVLSNPPYVTEQEHAQLEREVREHDPRLALVGGGDGLDAYREIAPLAARLLKPDGWLGVEIGAGQEGMVKALFAEAGLVDAADFYDLAGHVRAVFGRRLP